MDTLADVTAAVRVPKGSSLSPFNDARLGQRLTISCHSISGSGEGGRGRSLGKEETNPSLAPSVATSSLLRAVGSPGPPVAHKGPPPCVGGRRSHSSTCRLPRPCQQSRDTASCARRVWTRAVSSCPPAGALDRVNTALSLLLAERPPAPHRVGRAHGWAGSPQLPESLGLTGPALTRPVPSVPNTGEELCHIQEVTIIQRSPALHPLPSKPSSAPSPLTSVGCPCTPHHSQAASRVRNTTWRPCKVLFGAGGIQSVLAGGRASGAGCWHVSGATAMPPCPGGQHRSGARPAGCWRARGWFCNARVGFR